jgi:DNA-binding transcriptional MerR regulator
MKIGQLAAAAGVSVQTVRYYENRKLLPTPARLSSGYRDYPMEIVDTIRAVKELQVVGFTLKEIKAFLQLLTGQPHNPANTRKLAESKLHDMGEQIKRLEKMRDVLSERLATCTCCNQSPGASVSIGKRQRTAPVLEAGRA